MNGFGAERSTSKAKRKNEHKAKVNAVEAVRKVFEQLSSGRLRVNIEKSFATAALRWNIFEREEKN